MNKLANKIVLSQLIKRAASEGEKPYSSAEPSFVDRLVTGMPLVAGRDGVDPFGGGLANNVAREAEVLGGTGGGSLLYPRLATLAGGILGGGLGYGAAKLSDTSDENKITAAILGGLAGSLAGRYTGVGMRNKYLEKKNPGFTTSDVTPWAVGQRDIGSLLGGLGGGIGGGLLGGGVGAGLAALAALATGNNVRTTAGVGAGVGGALGAGVGALLGRPKGEEITDELRHSREAKSLKKKASLADWIDEYRDNQSSAPEWLSTVLGTTAGATALPAALQYSNYAGKAVEDLQAAKTLRKELNPQLTKAIQRLRSVDPNTMTAGTATPRKLKDVYKETVDDLVKQRNELYKDIRKAKPHAAFANSSVNKLIKTLGKNKRFAIPGAALATGLGALGTHNMID